MSEGTIDDLRTQLADARAFQKELAQRIRTAKEEAFDAGYDLGFRDARAGDYTTESERPCRSRVLLIPLLECDSCKDRISAYQASDGSKCPSCINGHWRATTRARPRCGTLIPAWAESHAGCAGGVRGTPVTNGAERAANQEAPASQRNQSAVAKVTE